MCGKLLSATELQARTSGQPIINSSITQPDQRGVFPVNIDQMFILMKYYDQAVMRGYSN